MEAEGKSQEAEVFIMDVLDAVLRFFDHNRIFIDLLFFSTGLVYARLRPYFFIFRVALIAARALRTYFKSHPVGRQHAAATKDDEQLDQMLSVYDDKWRQFRGNSETCLGPGQQA